MSNKFLEFDLIKAFFFITDDHAYMISCLYFNQSIMMGSHLKPIIDYFTVYYD